MNLVTGGSGFVGGHVVRALLARGEPTRCLVRPASDRSHLQALSVELVSGDVTDRDTVREAMAGVDVVYHCAADYRLYAREPHELYVANVDGTENVLAAAAEAGVKKLVYTSSVGALGLNEDGTPAVESTPVSFSRLIGHYKRSKYLAERRAEDWAARGLPVIIVNPSTPVGEMDVKPTPTGSMIVDFLNRKMPAYVDTGLNLIDVRDVAAGHLLAAQKGRAGEKYILGNRNLTLKEIFGLLQRITGVPAPQIRLPHWLPLAAAAIETSVCRLTGGIPRVPLDAVKMSRYKMYFDSGKAVRELGLPQSPVEDALERAAVWFRERGYARG